MPTDPTNALGVGRADYQDRRDRRVERLEARAAKRAAEAHAADAAARQILDVIPPGQPILVGHHSERRHRRDLAKVDRNMRRALEADREAKRLRSAAESAAANGAISSDDPDAIAKLEARLAALEAQRTAYREHNRRARKGGTDTLPGYVLSNHSANMRRVKQRIAALQARAARAPRCATIGDWTVEENAAANRCQLRTVDGRRATPDERAELKRHGFRWAPSEGAWQRQITARAWHDAESCLRTFGGDT